MALVLASGAVGVALGIGLSRFSDDDTPATPVPDSGAGGAGRQATSIATVPPAANSTATPTAPAAAPAPATTTAPDTTTTATDAQAPRAQVRVNVLDARLFTDSTPSGARTQRARVTVRIRADNASGQRVTLDPPTLRVGSVRIATDPDAAAVGGATFEPLRAGASQTVTVRFSLEGEATPKVVRDRRARILIAGQSLPIRVRVQAPTR